MVKVGIIFVILAILFIIDSVFFAKKFIRREDKWKGYQVIKYKLQNKSYRFLVADTAEKQAKGLMDVRDVRELDGADGMIFLFKKKDIYTFWNKNTYVDLDIYWISDNKMVGYDMLPSILKTRTIRTVQAAKPANKVIELISR